MMTRKHYIKIGNIIKDNTVGITDDTIDNPEEVLHIRLDWFVHDMCQMFKEDNINFNWTKFTEFVNDID